MRETAHTEVDMPRRFLLTGGGTGGHVTPALAVAGALAQKYEDADFRYVGLGDKAEAIMAPKAGLPLSRVSSRGMPSPGLGLIPFAFSLGLGIVQALGILLRHRPTLIVATGGYVAAPVVLANAMLRSLRLAKTPLLVHEQNSHLGRMNQLAARFADLVAVSFPETLKQLPASKGVWVGYPVRQSCQPGDRHEARQQLGIPADARVIFAFGGSQGARTINRAVADAAGQLLAHDDIWIIQGCGRPFNERASRGTYHGYKDVEERLQEVDATLLKHPRYLRHDFIDDMAACYAASDLVICRAGAGSLMEVCAQSKPAIVIPKANLPGDHQVRNARVLERARACRVLYERIDPANSGQNTPFVPGPRLADLVMRILDAPEQHEAMAEAAGKVITSDAASLMTECAAYLLGEGPLPEPELPRDVPVDRIMGLRAMGMERLLQQVSNEIEPPLDAPERELLLSKVDGLLASPAWVDRARGCRITGLAGYRDAAPIIQTMATEDEPMVRRDAFKGLRGLGPAVLAPAEMKDTLIQGLDDNYYEARMEAAATAAVCAHRLDTDQRREITDILARRCRDMSSEVRMAACRALGKTADQPEPVMTALDRLKYDAVWKVRGRLFDAYAELSDRGIIDAVTAQEALDAILITANGYLTEYQIRHRRNDAVRRVKRREA